jgi:predicted enzyme related to lactoylglutathione lyase
MPRPIHFEFTAEDPDSLAKFYESALGWKVQKWEGPIDYWLFMTGEEGEPGIDGGLMKRTEETPPGTVNTVDVPDLDEYIERAKAAGGSIITPKMAVTGVGWMCYVMDPEGNVFGLMEGDPEAK